MPKKAIESSMEPIVCEACHHVNILTRKEFERRRTKSYHFMLEPSVFEGLRHYVRGYGTWNNGLSMLLFEVEKMKMEQQKEHIRNIQVKNANE